MTQASIDILAELGYLSSCIMMITLLECIKQARWPTDGPLSIFPGVDVSKEKKRVENTALPPKTLVEVLTLPPPVLENAIRLIGVPDAFRKSVSVNFFLLFFPRGQPEISNIKFYTPPPCPSPQLQKKIIN